MILFREDFLEVPTDGAQLWLSDLYVSTLANSVEKNHTTLVGLKASDVVVYMTNMNVVAEQNKVRAIDVRENLKVYVSSVIPLFSALCSFGSGSVLSAPFACYNPYPAICSVGIVISCSKLAQVGQLECYAASGFGTPSFYFRGTDDTGDQRSTSLPGPKEESLFTSSW